MPRPIHFEIHAADPERAMRFYRELFGWSFTPWGSPGYWLVKTGEAPEPGIDGGLVQRRGQPPTESQAVNAFPCTVGVKSVDEVLARAVALGGQVAVPRMPIPGVGWLGYAKDTEGNLFGLHQLDTSAR
jgi:predicted enzyme related to lactoylglutathione lyase